MPWGCSEQVDRPSSTGSATRTASAYRPCRVSHRTRRPGSHAAQSESWSRGLLSHRSYQDCAAASSPTCRATTYRSEYTACGLCPPSVQRRSMSASTSCTRASGVSGTASSAVTVLLNCHSRVSRLGAYPAGSLSNSARHQANVSTDLAGSPP